MERVTLRDFIEKAIELSGPTCKGCGGELVYLWIGDDDCPDYLSIHCEDCIQEHMIAVGFVIDETCSDIFEDVR